MLGFESFAKRHINKFLNFSYSMINLKHFRELFPYYLSFIFRYGFSIVAILGVLYFNLKGFSYPSIALYFSITALAALIFEVPTGVFADKFGRKKSVLVGFFAETIIFALYPFVSSDIQLWTLGALAGFFSTFASGAETSLIVDNLKKKELVQEYYVTMSTLFSVTGALSGLTGYLFFRFFDIQQPIGKFIAIDMLWFIYALAMLISALIFMFKVHEASFNKSKEKSLAFTWSSLTHIVTNHNLRLIFLWNLIFMTVFYAWFILYLPYLDSYGIHFDTISLAYVLLSLVGLPFAKIGQQLYHKIKSEKLFLLMSYVGYLGWSLLVLIPGKAFAYLYWFVRWNLPSTFKPIESAYEEEHIPEERRSTISSMQTIVNQAGFVIGPLLGGYLLTVTTPQYAIFYSSLLIIPVLVIIGMLKE